MYGKAGKYKVEPHGKSHVKKGDTVVVLSGKDRGKQGKVLRVSPAKGTAVVERMNFSKRHTRPNPGKNIQGGILERESPLRLDKLQVVCPSCGEPTRLGSHRTDEGASTRYCRKCKSDLGS
ncbi:MAG TPA: 50S ribosomal protein L24 [Thermoanaerobaculia bacterium]|nr:50S ribosomal protein L24 [Thermoanaerobaculia bacterium]